MTSVKVSKLGQREYDYDRVWCNYTYKIRIMYSIFKNFQWDWNLPIGLWSNCHKNGKNPLLFQFIRKAIEWTVIIKEECLSCLLLSNLLLSRMTPYANEIIGEYQCNFRRDRSTIGHIFSIRQILEKKWEYNKYVCQLFIDFEKAYDSIKIYSLYYILIKLHVEKS
jgi:Reverse transcriptase (RNA-dependent DNA polymerase).